MPSTIAVAVAVALLAISGCDSQNGELLEAIGRKDAETVRNLVGAGADLEPPSNLHEVNKPLAYAAAYGNLEIVKLLVEAGADLNGQVAYGDVALIKADEHDNADVVEYLIEAGADVNIPSRFGMTPFIGLCAGGQLEFVQLAVDRGADVNSSFLSTIGDGAGTKNLSPLQAAVTYGHAEVVAFLLSQGADADATDYKNRTPMDLAVANGHDDIAKLLREHLKQAGDH